MFTDRESEPIELKPQSRSLGPLRKLVYKPFSQKTTFICKFCGGKSCKHENWLTYPASAIKGLNSDWITPNILATQRPSTRLIKEYDIIQAFTDAGINAIFNLQEPGEHPFCGDGIHPQSGFSYFPEEFYQHGIYYFNFGWKDMTATSTDIVLKILKQMSFSLANGNKIAIHCHAGRGRTGLIIAAWLIYSNNMTAKEAIKVVRSKRKGAIQNKAQEEVLMRLEKEIKESRLIFHSSPKFKLEDFIFHQKKLLPLSYESETRFVPNIVLVCLERLETLMISGICTPQDIALAFYNPNDMTFFKGEWTNYHEKTLKGIKEKMNQGNFELSEIDDPRFLAQSILDYFDHFVSPAIRSQFIDIIHQQVHHQENLTKEKKDELFSKIDKKEFLLVECFARFFSKLVDNNEADIEHFRKAVLRLCISLVLERKKWDKLFLKRSLIKEHSGDDRVTYLNVFMLKWIENFSQNFTEFYMVSKSPLKINEKLIEEKMERAERRRGTYLDALPGSPKIDLDRIYTPKSGGNTPKAKGSTPRNFGTDKLKTISLFAHQRERSNFIDLLNDEQANQQDDTERNESKHTPAGTSRNQIDTPDSDNLEVRSEGLSRDPSTKVLVRVHSTKLPFKHGRFTDVLEADRLPSSSFSPKVKNRLMQATQPRMSLLRMEGNPFINNSNTQNNSNIQRNYDDFFSNNVLGSEETPMQSMGQVGGDSDSMSDVSDKDKFEEMMCDVEKLSEKKQDLLLEKLLKMREARPPTN